MSSSLTWKLTVQESTILLKNFALHPPFYIELCTPISEKVVYVHMNDSDDEMHLLNTLNKRIFYIYGFIV